MAGLTKSQLFQKQMKDAERTREYYSLMRPVWAEQARERAEKLLVIGMLLDANWNPTLELFVKKTHASHPNGIASHWETFYNELGEEVPRPKGYKSA